MDILPHLNILLINLKPKPCVTKLLTKNVLNLVYVPDCFISQEMCDNAVEETWFTRFEYIPDRFKNQELYEKAVDKYPLALNDVPYQFKIQDMSDEAVMIPNVYIIFLIGLIVLLWLMIMVYISMRLN